MPGDRVRVVTDFELDSTVVNWQLRSDDSAGLELMAKRLEAVGSDPSIRAESAGWVVGLGQPSIGDDPEPARWVRNWTGLQLNPRQRQAVRQALASEVTFLWGPPGTGKTDVVGYVVEGSVRQGLNVLFLAPTKVAVDQALERVCDLLSGDEGFAEGLVQRAGEIEIASLRERYGSAIAPEQIAERVSAVLDDQFARAKATMKAVGERIEVHEKAIALHRKRDEEFAQWTTAEDQHREARTDLETTTRASARLAREVADAPRPSGFFAARNEDRLRRLRLELTDAEGRRQQAARSAESAASIVAAARRRVETAELELASMMAKVETLPPLRELRDHENRLTRELDDLTRQRSDIRRAVRSRCRVLGATVAKAVQSRRLLDRVDVVVIDEAGMVDLPSAWLAAGLAQKRLVVAGDFRQLPAVTKGSGDKKASAENRDHSRQWCARDPFRAAGLVDDSGRVRIDRRLVALDTQYRMQAPICALVNAVAYPDAPLSTGRGEGSRIPQNPVIDAPVLLIDTSSRRIPGLDGKTNTVNEAVVHEIVRGLQYEGVLPGRKWQRHETRPGERATDRLAVIAPYRAQVKALRTSLQYRFGEEYDEVVDTIHRFQGSQRPVVIFDTAVGDSRRPGLGRFYEGTGLSSDTCRLLNVALSRAQDHVVVVADVEHLRRHLPVGSEARTMLDHLEHHAQVLSADQFVPTRDAAQLGQLSDEELRRPAFFPADEVPKAVEWDIDRATRSIHLYCPFLDPGPVRKWSKLFGERARAGVRVLISTRDADEQRDDNAAERHRARIAELRKAGCEVDFRERMHEKVMIVDETVLWHGSLNLLANVGPTDLMMRLTDPASCERVERVIGRARKERPARNFVPKTVQSGGNGNHPSGPAGSGAPQNRPMQGSEIGGRLYLAVPFADKDQAKTSLGARWDQENRLWFVDSARVSRQDAGRWLP